MRKEIRNNLEIKKAQKSCDSNDIKNLDSDSIMGENVFQQKSSFSTSTSKKKKLKFVIF